MQNARKMPIHTVALGICLLLLPSTKVIAADGFCNRPQPETVSSIKAMLVAKVNATEIVKRGEEREMGPEDVKILQTYEKDGFILVSYLYSCCFEGMIVLFARTENGLKEIGYFNGYDTKGVFVGFERKLVVRSLSGLVPLHVKEMIACYKD